MFIQTEHTPNPETLKFLPGRVVLKTGTAFFQKSQEKDISQPFVQKLFQIDGVEGVFFGSDFITITKNEGLEWQVMKPFILGAIVEHFKSGEEIYNSQNKDKENVNDSDIVKQIKELLDTRVRPAVAMDGGEIIYDSFEDGIVY